MFRHDWNITAASLFSHSWQTSKSACRYVSGLFSGYYRHGNPVRGVQGPHGKYLIGMHLKAAISKGFLCLCASDSHGRNHVSRLSVPYVLLSVSCWWVLFSFFSLESLEGIYSNLAQLLTWIRGWTRFWWFKVKDQGHCDHSRWLD